MGTSSAVARIGALITPFVAQVCRSIRFTCFQDVVAKTRQIVSNPTEQEGATVFG